MREITVTFRVRIEDQEDGSIRAIQDTYEATGDWGDAELFWTTMHGLYEVCKHVSEHHNCEEQSCNLQLKAREMYKILENRVKPSS